MTIEIALRLLSGIFSKAGGLFLIGFFFGSIVLVNSDNLYAFIESISDWFVQALRMLLGL